MKNNYISTKDFVVRSPVESIDLTKVFSDNLYLLCSELVENELFMNNLILASPVLFDRACKWKISGFTDKAAEWKLLISLYKYWIRICTRCTPFGGFAGISLGKITDSTSIVFGEVKDHKYISRLDMRAISEIIEMLNLDSEIRSQTLFFPNNTIYEGHNCYRYIDYNIELGIRRYFISEIPMSWYVKLAIKAAQFGAKINDLVDIYLSHGFESHTALEFVNEMIDNRLLVSAIEPLVTGEETLKSLIAILEPYNLSSKYLTGLKKIYKHLSSQNLLNRTEYGIIESEVAKLVPSYRANDLVQTDTFLYAEKLELSKALVDKIIEAAVNLMPLGGQSTKSSPMLVFVRKFEDRYENEEIPLSIALDTEIGIGYGNTYDETTEDSDLLSGIVINRKEIAIESSSFMKEFQTRKLYEAILNNNKEIIISEEDIKTFRDRPHLSPPSSMYIFGSLLSTSLDDKLVFALGNIGFSSATYLGRFCSGDNSLAKSVREYLKDEANNFDGILAEIVHLPQSRTGNVLSRPVLREFEIPIITKGSVDDDHLIPISDLYLKMEHGNLELRSRKLKARVFPRLSNAHNPDRNCLPVYRFLVDYQFYNSVPRFYWDWGDFNNYEYLPRVIYRNVILYHAQWCIKIEDYPLLRNISLNDIVKYFEEIRTKRNIPQYVICGTADLQLVVDLTNYACLDLIRKDLVKNGLIYLREFLQCPENCIASDITGKTFTNELIIPIKKVVHENSTITSTFNSFSKPGIPVKFFPGSEWLYIKIYCGAKSSDQILLEVIEPFLKKFKQSFSTFFFIRYKDPDNHLRIRIKLLELAKHGEVLAYFYVKLAKYTQAKIVNRVCYDCYNREIFRYGKNTMELSEQIFHIDSVAVIRLLKQLSEDGSERNRWLITLRAIDMFMADFGFTLVEKISFFKILAADFLKENQNEHHIRKQINARFRKDSKEIDDVLDEGVNHDVLLKNAIKIFYERKKKSRSIIVQIKNILANEIQSEVNLNSLIRSYIHMFINRVFNSNQRKKEVVIYNYLFRYYSSKLVREKSK